MKMTIDSCTPLHHAAPQTPNMALMKNKTVRLLPSQVKALKALAKDRARDPSFLIREAITEYMTARESKPQKSTAAKP